MAGASRAQDFITALERLQGDCGVDGLRMSDYGFTREELPELARNARATMGGLFESDPAEMCIRDRPRTR